MSTFSMWMAKIRSLHVKRIARAFPLGRVGKGGGLGFFKFFQKRGFRFPHKKARVDKIGGGGCFKKGSYPVTYFHTN